jgi:lipoprotein
MKKNIISALFGGLVILMAGCSSEIPGNSESQTTSGGAILRLDINKADMTRAGLESTSFDEGDEVFVVVTDRTNPDILTVTTKATYTGSKWVLADEIDLAGGNSGVVWTIADIQVYYPYDMALEGYDKESGKINLSSFQKDILYGASYGWSKGNSNATVSCKHAMTRLTLALNNNSDTDVTVERVKITNSGEQSFLGSKGTLDSNGINVTGYSDLITVLKSGNLISASSVGYYDILLPPTLAAYDRMLDWYENEGIPKTVLKFEVDVNDRTVKFDIDANAWEEGHQYTYPVNIKEHEKPNPDNFEYVDLGLSVLWATCNVGASNPYEIGKYFFWGDIKGYIKGETYSSTDVSFINSKSDEELLEEGIIELAPNSADSQYKYRLSSKYDACTHNMGFPWRMPMADEIQEMVDNTNFELIKVDDMWMFKFISKVPGFEDKYIILPYPEGAFNTSGGGVYNYNLYSNTDEPSGNWWSSSVPYDYERRGMLLEILWYYMADKPSTWIRSLGRSRGYNIRGVRARV